LANGQKSKSNKDDTKALPSMHAQRVRAFAVCKIGTDFYLPLFDAKYQIEKYLGKYASDRI